MDVGRGARWQSVAAALASLLLLGLHAVSGLSSTVAFYQDAAGAGRLSTTDGERAVRHAACQPDAGYEGLPLVIPAGNASFPALFRCGRRLS